MYALIPFIAQYLLSPFQPAMFCDPLDLNQDYLWKPGFRIPQIGDWWTLHSTAALLSSLKDNE